MKKLISSLFALAVIVSMTVLTSCGDKAASVDVSKIVENYDNGAKMTEADYSALLDYVDAAMDEALPLAKEIQEAALSGNLDKAEDLQKKAEKIEAKYPDMEKALNIIENAEDSDMGAANVEKGKKLIKKITSATGMDFEDML